MPIHVLFFLDFIFLTTITFENKIFQVYKRS